MKNRLSNYTGLTKKEVNERFEKLLVNYDTTIKTKSVFCLYSKCVKSLEI